MEKLPNKGIFTATNSMAFGNLLMQRATKSLLGTMRMASKLAHGFFGPMSN
jgi:hypothetical protein